MKNWVWRVCGQESSGIGTCIGDCLRKRPIRAGGGRQCACRKAPSRMFQSPFRKVLVERIVSLASYLTWRAFERKGVLYRKMRAGFQVCVLSRDTLPG